MYTSNPIFCDQNPSPDHTFSYEFLSEVTPWYNPVYRKLHVNNVELVVDISDLNHKNSTHKKVSTHLITQNTLVHLQDDQSWSSSTTAEKSKPKVSFEIQEKTLSWAPIKIKAGVCGTCL